MNANRDITIDIAKGIGITLVVIGHTPTCFGGSIYLFHMALFFILSGWCFKQRHTDSAKNIFKFSWNRIMALLLPIGLFHLIALGIKLLLPNTDVDGFIDKYHLFGTFWFLKDLSKACIIIAVLHFSQKHLFRKASPNAFLILLMFVAIPFVSKFILSLSIALYAALFFYIGFYLKENAIMLKLTSVNKGGKMLIFSGVIIVLLLMMPVFFRQTIGLVETVKFQDPLFYIIYTLMSLAGSYLIISLSSLLSTSKLGVVFSMIGRYTMPIMLLQWSAFCLTDLSLAYSVHPIDSTILFLVKLIAGIVLSILTYRIYKLSKLDRLYAKLFVR